MKKGQKMTTNTKIRFAIDTNVLGYLAMAKLYTKQQFFYYNNVSETTYNNLLWLNKMVDMGKIELIVPRTVFREVIRKPQIKISAQKVMTAEKMTRLNRIVNFKKISQKFLTQNQNIKIAYVNEGFIGDYRVKFNQLANAYVENPQFPDNIPLSLQIRQKPFLREDPNKFPHDAQIMAESTLLGLQLISFDHHLIGKKPFNIPQKIKVINQDLLNTSTSSISFINFIKIIKREGTFLPYLNKSYKHMVFPVFVDKVEYIPHKEFNKKIKEITEIKKEFHDEYNKCLSRKELFDFLETPLETENLQPNEALKKQQEIALEEAEKQRYLENLEIANMRTLFLKYLIQVIDLELVTPKAKPKITTKKPIKTKIKLDFFNPNANQILDSFFGTTNAPSQRASENQIEPTL